MKRIAVFFIFVCIAISSLPLYADSGLARLKNTILSSYTLSLSPQFGMLWGQGEEQVYTTGNKLYSQLLWDIKPLLYVGMSIDFSRKYPLEGPGIFGVFSTKFGIPANSGVMEDRDWLARGGILSNYSRHDNFTDGAMILDMTTGLSIPAWRFLVIRFSVGFSCTRFSWDAYDGYYQYGRYDKINKEYEPLKNSDPVIPLNGAVISYSQDWFSLPFGLGVSIFPGRLFSGTLYCDAGPVIKFFGQDNHYKRENDDWNLFADKSDGGYVMEFGGEFKFSPREKFSLLLRSSWRDINTGPGRESFGRRPSTKEWSYFGKTSGGRFRALDLGIGFEVRL
ncbi:MAG: omptin family outer membrane protease [Treponema sp.]|jgi:outer membrane protease|nr:omptin family outer membrane protease [Treponema sp.]